MPDNILDVSYDTGKHNFCMIAFYLKSNLYPQKVTVRSKQFQCKNFTAGEDGK